MLEKAADQATVAGRPSADLPVDLIRTVAVILVIMIHASVESYTGLMLDAFQGSIYWWTTAIYNAIARVCVPLFVMLSGYLLLQPVKVNEPIRVFLKKRFTRIGLALGFWSIIYFLWSYYVHGQVLTVSYIIQGLLTGPYYHFWFLYLIAGLYFITPILRVLVTYGDRKILRYLIIIWFVAVAVVPLFQLFSGFYIDTYLIIIAGWTGYFVLGAYLHKVHISKKVLFGLLALGYGWTVYGSWLMAFPFHYKAQYYYFFDSLTINVIVASVALFLILSKAKPDWPGKDHPHSGWLVRTISENSLPIFLGQLIVLESLQMGFFGFYLSLRVLNPMWEIPLATVVTLFITLGWVWLMGKVPVLKRLIGRA